MLILPSSSTRLTSNNFISDKELIKTLETEIERGEWKSLTNKEKETLKKPLKKELRLSKRKKAISLRVSQRGLKLLKRKSLETGILYQIIISSFNQKYLQVKLFLSF